MNPRWKLRASLCAALAAAASSSLPGCQLFSDTAQLPVDAVSAFTTTGEKDSPLNPAAVQMEVQRYADEFIGRSTVGIDNYATVAGTPAAQTQALKWKLSLCSSVVQIASSANPTADLIDLLALVTLVRVMLEEHYSADGHAKEFELWLTTTKTLEADAWKMVAQVFTREDQLELADAIRHWLSTNVTTADSFFARPQEFVGMIREQVRKPSKSRRENSLLNLVGLDPTAGLDPAVREVTRTRLFAERALFAVQRTPTLLRWQVELMVDQVANGPGLNATLEDAKRVADSADRISRAVESASKTFEAIPDRATEERKAILLALETQEERLRELTAEVDRTLKSAESMSTALRPTIVTFDALVKRLGVGEPSEPRDPDAPPKHPFNILEFAATADRITVMAKELDDLIRNANGAVDSPAIDKRIQDLHGVVAQAKEEARSLLVFAALLAGGVIVFAFGCALAYRRLQPIGPSSAPASAREGPVGART